MQVVGSEEVVAATVGRCKLVVWSSKGEMDQLHTLNLHDYSCSNESCQHFGGTQGEEIKSVLVVDCSKVAILVEQVFIHFPHVSNKVSLILLEKGNCGWEYKNLGCFPSGRCFLASDGGWLALLVGEQEKMKVWHGNESQQDKFFTESDGKLVNGCQRMSIYSIDAMLVQVPHILILNAQSISHSALIKVYKMEATELHLVKSFRFEIEGRCRLTPIANKFFLGFLVPQNRATVVHVFEKKKLFDASLSLDKIERRRIEVEGKPVAITSLLP